jgi:HSP20 family protein
MAEMSTAYLVTVEIAGINDDSVEISVYEDALVIEGERVLVQPPREELRYHTLEILRGPFKLELALPAGSIDRGSVQAAYERGLLRITLPKIGSGIR